MSASARKHVVKVRIIGEEYSIRSEAPPERVRQVAEYVDGVIRQVPLGWKTLNIDFGDGPKTAVTIPWGDIATAYYTTAIPNIETYIPMAPRTARRLARANWIRPLLATGPVQRFLQQVENA